jgi:hypothetical protein
MELFLLFDGPMMEDLILDVDECLIHTQLKEGVLHTALHVKVPTRGVVKDQIMTVVRRVKASPGVAAENEILNAAGIMAREVKALIEFKEEIAIVSYMDDEGVPVAVGEQYYTVDRNRLKIPEVEYSSHPGESNILSCVRYS